MIRKVLKLIGAFSAAVVAIVLSYFCLLIYPGVLFAEKVTYKNFVVRSNETFGGPAVRRVLDEVDAALRTSEINEPALAHQILLAHDNQPFRTVQNVAWRIGSGNAQLRRALTFNRALPPYTSQIITFRIPSFEGDSLLHPETKRATNMTQAFIHEATHSLIAASVGARRLPAVPMWKKEGYAEYVAASVRIIYRPGYKLKESVERLLSQNLSWMLNSNGDLAPIRYNCVGMSILSNEMGNVGPTCYYLSRLLVEYQLDVRSLVFDELMDPEISDTATFKQMLEAYEAGGL